MKLNFVLYTMCLYAAYHLFTIQTNNNIQAIHQRPLLNSSRETCGFDNMANTYFFCLLNSFNSAQVWTTNTKPSWIHPVSLETKPFIVTATHN